MLITRLQNLCSILLISSIPTAMSENRDQEDKHEPPWSFQMDDELLLSLSKQHENMELVTFTGCVLAFPRPSLILPTSPPSYLPPLFFSSLPAKSRPQMSLWQHGYLLRHFVVSPIDRRDLGEYVADRRHLTRQPSPAGSTPQRWGSTWFPCGACIAPPVTKHRIASREHRIASAASFSALHDARFTQPFPLSLVWHV